MRCACVCDGEMEKGREISNVTGTLSSTKTQQWSIFEFDMIHTLRALDEIGLTISYEQIKSRKGVNSGRAHGLTEEFIFYVLHYKNHRLEIQSKLAN